MHPDPQPSKTNLELVYVSRCALISWHRHELSNEHIAILFSIQREAGIRTLVYCKYFPSVQGQSRQCDQSHPQRIPQLQKLLLLTHANIYDGQDGDVQTRQVHGQSDSSVHNSFNSSCCSCCYCTAGEWCAAGPASGGTAGTVTVSCTRQTYVHKNSTSLLILIAVSKAPSNRMDLSCGSLKWSWGFLCETFKLWVLEPNS